MRVLLDGLLPRLFPGLPFMCVPHEGKSDLERSIPRKLRRWREPGVRFAVVRDNDGGNCRALKNDLRALCRAGHQDDTLIRIVCQESRHGIWASRMPWPRRSTVKRFGLLGRKRDSAIPTPCRARTRCSSDSLPSSRGYPAPGGWHGI